MSAEVATFDRVRAAALGLRQRGITATADRVMEITGGSKSTVLAHLRRMRGDSMTDQEAVPPAVIEMARPALMEVYEAGRRTEAERSRALHDRTALLIDELESQIDELASDNARLLQEASDRADTCARAREDSLALAERLSSAEETIRTLEASLASERSDGAKRLSDAMGKLDAVLALHELASMTPGTRMPRRAQTPPSGDTG